MLSYIIFIIATIPASVVINAIELPQGIALSKVSGSIWQTHIDKVEIPTKNKQANIIINKVTANLAPMSLLTLNPSIKINFGGRLLDGPQGELTLTNIFQKITVTNSNIQLAAHDIIQHLILPIEIQALGEVKLKLAQFALGKPLCTTAHGEIVWQRAALTAFEQTIELDTLKADIHCQKGILAIKINPKNKLGLTFTTYIRSGTQISGNGYLTPSATLPKAIHDVLPFLGKPDSKGRYHLRF